MNSKLILTLGLVLVILVLGASYFFFAKNSKVEVMTKPAMVESKEAVMDKGKGEVMTKSGFLGNVIAGTKTPYISFTKKDYDKAIIDGKIIFLDFYANWCPICRAEAPEIEAGFNSLDNENIIGFRVNFKDSETDEDESKLAKEFEIPYQHTKVILRNGKVLLKDGDSWDRNKLIEELSKF